MGWFGGVLLIVLSALLLYWRRRLVRRWLLPIVVLAPTMTIGFALVAAAIVAKDPSRLFGDPCAVYLVTERAGAITGARLFVYGRTEYRFSSGASTSLVAEPKCALRGDMIVNDTTRHLRVERAYYTFAGAPLLRRPDDKKIVERFDPFTAVFMGEAVSWFGQAAPLTRESKPVVYWLTWD